MRDSVIISSVLLLIENVRRFYANSGTKRVVSNVAGFFRRLWDKSLLKSLLGSDNSRVEAAFDGSLLGFVGNALKKRAETERRFRFKSGSFILNWLDDILKSLPYTSIRSFGLALVTFAAAALPFNLSGLWLYVFCAVLAMGAVFILINRSLWNICAESSAARFAAGFFGGDLSNAETQPVRRFHGFYAILGVVLGVLFAVLDINTFVIAAGGLLGGALILWKVEAGVLLTAFFIPIMPTKIIMGLCAITVASFFIKTMIQRSNTLPFRPQALGGIAALFAVTLCYSVVVSYFPGSSLYIALLYILFIAFFFVAKNVLRNKRLLFAAISLLAVAALLVSLYGIYQQVTGNFVETASWIDAEMFNESTARIYSTLGNPNVLGEYLIFAVVISLGMLYYMKKPVYKLASLGILGISGLCMLLTQSRGAWLGLLLALGVFALMRDRRLLILAVAMVLIMPAVLPETVITRFLSIGSLADSSTSYRVNIWLACLTMLKTVWLTGIGPGVDSFRYIYQEYAFNAVEAPHSHNLYLQVIIDFGVVGLILLLAMLIIFFKYLLSTVRRSRDNFMKTMAAALAAGMFGFLIQGFTDNVWYNNRIVAFFWLILAIAAAAHNLIKGAEPEGIV